MLRSGIFDHHEQGQINGLATATPSFTGFFGPCPQGFNWYIELANYFVGATHTAIVEIAVQTGSTIPAAWDRVTRVWTFGGTALANGAQAFPNGIYVPEGNFVVVNFTAGTLAQNDQCTLNLQIAVHELNPYIGITSQDLHELQASHENIKAGSQVTHPATAQERAYDQEGDHTGSSVYVFDPQPGAGVEG